MTSRIPLLFAIAFAASAQTAFAQCTYVLATPTSLRKSDADTIVDGTNDDGAFREAIQHVADNGGGRILLLEGDYVFNNSTEIKISSHNIEIQGQGRATRIHVAGSKTPFYLNRAHDIVLRDIHFIVASKQLTQPVIHLFATNVVGNPTVRGCRFERIEVSVDSTVFPDDDPIAPCSAILLEAATSSARPDTDTSVFFNIFDSIVVKGCADGIRIRIQDTMPTKTAFIGHNSFCNVYIAKFERALSFEVSDAHSGTIAVDRNLFRNFVVQPTAPHARFDTGIKNVVGRNNTFENAIVYDIGGVPSDRDAWTIGSGARRTTLINCQFPNNSRYVDSGADTSFVGPRQQ